MNRSKDTLFTSIGGIKIPSTRSMRLTEFAKIVEVVIPVTRLTTINSIRMNQQSLIVSPKKTRYQKTEKKKITKVGGKFSMVKMKMTTHKAKILSVGFWKLLMKQIPLFPRADLNHRVIFPSFPKISGYGPQDSSVSTFCSKCCHLQSTLWQRCCSWQEMTLMNTTQRSWDLNHPVTTTNTAEKEILRRINLLGSFLPRKK